MKLAKHHSAKASHYNEEAKSYDVFNEKNSKVINSIIEKILKQHDVKTVLDLTCGIGSQVFWFHKRRYNIIGCDINLKMLNIAKNKAKKEKMKIQFIKGDMRSTQAGQFDSVITIFNAVGHLTKKDFEKSMRNIHGNLNKNGLYIFDIFNLSYLLKDNNITKLTIDWQEISGNTKIREIQYSTIDKEGVLASYYTYYKQKGAGKPKVSKSSQTLQIYTAKQLKDMLNRNGFKVLANICISTC